MKSFITRLFVVVAGVVLLLPASHIFADTTPDPLKVKEKDLQDIVDVLKEAKTETDPAPPLARAAKLLAKQEKKTARTDKDKDADADLDKASAAVTAAQTALTAKDTDKVHDEIDHATNLVKMAIEAKERKGN